MIFCSVLTVRFACFSFSLLLFHSSEFLRRRAPSKLQHYVIESNGCGLLCLVNAKSVTQQHPVGHKTHSTVKAPKFNKKKQKRHRLSKREKAALMSGAPPTKRHVLLMRT